MIASPQFLPKWRWRCFTRSFEKRIGNRNSCFWTYWISNFCHILGRFKSVCAGVPIQPNASDWDGGGEGGGADSAPCLTREAMTVTRRARRQSKALNQYSFWVIYENFLRMVTGHIRGRPKVKIVSIRTIGHRDETNNNGEHQTLSKFLSKDNCPA